MRIVFFGSGAFGVPTLRRLVVEHDVILVVTQPDKPAGRNRALTPTPVAVVAEKLGIPILRPEKINDAQVVADIRKHTGVAFVVIAFGQKLGKTLLKDVFAINLHASLLPKFRGAAPINWAMITGERETGLSVITLADRMDAGDVLGQVVTDIDPHETAGELHDRLADMGPALMLEVLRRYEAGHLPHHAQVDRLATPAPKLSKEDGLLRIDQPAVAVRNRIHGLTPWPGCSVNIGGKSLRLLRVEVATTAAIDEAPGTLLADGTIACAPGAIRLLSVQPPGGKAMTFEAYRNGHNLAAGERCVTA